MKTLRIMLVCAAALALARGAFALTITARAIPNELYGGECVAISASVEGGGAEALTMYYKKSTESNWANAESQALLKRSTNYFTGSLPAVGATTTYDWYVTDGDVISGTQQTTVTFASNTLDYNRFHNGAKYNATTDPYGWQQQGSSSNFVAATPAGTSEWKANGVVWVNANGFGQTYVDTSIEMSFPVLYFQNIPASALPYIRSPKLEGGVGTIDFRSRLAATSIRSSAITLQVAYTDEEPAESNWVNVATYTYGTDNGSVFSRIHHEVLNDPGITYVRIFRSQHNMRSAQIGMGRLAIDNICITKPPAEVGISHKLENPGYPSQKDDVLIRCAVTNVVDATPATNRAVSAWFKYVAKDDDNPAASTSAWTKVEMAYMGRESGEGGRDWYEGTIPAQRTGYVWYYFEVEFDGYDYGVNPLTGERETLNPMYWDSNSGVETTSCDVPSAGARYQVRPYRSRYSRIAFDATEDGLDVPAMTLFDDETWQAVVGVDGQTVVSNYFRGYDYYEDDAEAYSTNVVTWGENNPDALSDPTLAGYLESSQYTNVTGRLVALNEKDYTGFYLYRFQSNDKDDDAAGKPEGDRRFDYIVKKAVYQDFDDWTASQDYYETSLGGLPTTTYAENFDGNGYSTKSGEYAAGSVVTTNAWEADDYGVVGGGWYKYEDFAAETPEESAERFTAEAMTDHGFRRMSSRILVDRKTAPSDATSNQSLAFQLDGKIENGDWVTRNVQSITYGLEKIDFGARASVDDDNFALYKDGTEWTLATSSAMYVSAKWCFQDLSPSKPYLSFIFFYKPTASYLAEEDPATWYELRVIKADAANTDDNTARFELWRRNSTGKDSTANPNRLIDTITVDANRLRTGSNYSLVNDEPAYPMNIQLYNNSKKLRVRVNVTGGNPNNAYTGANGIELNSSFTDESLSTVGGTIGFGVFDAVPDVWDLKVGTGSGLSDTLNGIVDTDWSHGGNRADGGGTRWTISGGHLTRPVPAQKIGVYINDCRGNVNEVLGTPYTNVWITSLSMQDFSIPVREYGRKFVTLRYDEGDGGAVIDDLWLYPWRARTRHEGGTATGYLDWTTKSQQQAWLESEIDDVTHANMLDRWAVLEGWVENVGGAFGTGVTFQRSRANPSLDQAVVSPFLGDSSRENPVNGMGSITFSCTVEGGKVVYGVERTDESRTAWEPVAVYTNGPGSYSRYVKVVPRALNERTGKYEDQYYGGRIRVRVYGQDDVGNLDRYPECGYDQSWGWTDRDAKITIDNLRAKDYPKDVNDNAWHAYNLLITDNDDLKDAGLIYNNSGKSCFLNNSPTDGAYTGESYTDDDPYLESPPLRGVGVGEIAFQYRIVPGTATAGTDGHIVVKVAPRRDTPAADWTTITNLVVSADGVAFVPFGNDKIFDEDNFVVRFYNSCDPDTPRVVIDNVLVTAPARPSFEFEYVRLAPLQPLTGSNTVVEAKIMREILNPQGIRIFCSFHKYDDSQDTWGYRNWFNPLDSENRVELDLVGDKVYRSADGDGIPGTFATDDIVEFVVWGVHSEIDWTHGEPPIVQGAETFTTPEWYKTYNTSTKKIVVVDQNTTNTSGFVWSPYFWVYSCAPGTFFANEINNWYSRTGGDRNTAEYVEFAAPAGTDIGGWKFQIVENYPSKESSITLPAGATVALGTTNGWGFVVWGDSFASGDMHIDYEFDDSADNTVQNLGTYGGLLVYRSNNMIEQMIAYGTTGHFDKQLWTETGRKTSGSRDSLSLLSKDDPADPDRLLPGATVDDFYWARATQSPYDVNGVGQIFATIGEGLPVITALYAPNGNEITNRSVLAWIDNFTSGMATADIQDVIDGHTQEQFENEYLLNMDLTKECRHSLRITGVGVDSTHMSATATLTRTEGNNAVGNGRAINGRLAVIGQETLDGDELDVRGNDVQISNQSFQNGDNVTIQFLRLRIVGQE